MSTARFTDDLWQLIALSYADCQSCGSALPMKVAAYAGYAADGSPLYVGDCCKHLISELATHVYWWWKADKRCEPHTMLWRYMDFAKFVALLEERSIYFARADKLGDPFEGASGIADRRPYWDEFYLESFREVVRTPPPDSAPSEGTPLSFEDVEREALRLLKEFSTGAERDRRCTFVSCWHANTGESEALWRLYCPPQTTGVAIQTTAHLMLAALDHEPQIELGRVQYIDFRHSFAGIHDRIFWKRKSLSHEAEVRAVIVRHDRQEDIGFAIPADLQKLLVSVVPSPFAPSWFTTLVKATMRRFHLDTNVVESELMSEPFY
jgi:hypothetical protein